MKIRILLLAGLCTASAWSDTTPVLSTAQETAVPEASFGFVVEKSRADGIDWVAMPIPISNPTIGNGLAFATLALYRLAGSDQPSQTSVGIFKTDNGSRGGALLQETYLGQTDWQINGVGLKADLNLDFYGIGTEQRNLQRAFPFSQDITGGAFWVLKTITPGLSVGPRYRWDTVKLSSDFDRSDIEGLPFELPPLNVEFSESTLELLVNYDTRNSRFAPSRGWFSEFSAAFTDKAIGSDVSYQRYTLAVNFYRRLSEDVVFGARGSFCKTSDGTPFFALCQFGLMNDLRGYVVGRYRDKAMFATQAEFRWSIWRRVGGVAFAGAGNVAERFSDLTFSDPLTSVGVGVRYLASKKNLVNVGIDVAYANNEYSYYFRIGEAF